MRALIFSTFVLLLLLHGVAHIVGFLGAWKPARTTLLGGRVDIGPAWMKLVGAGWLVLAIGFGIAALAAILGVAAWPVLVIALASGSLVLCVLQLPETKLGIVLDVVVIAGVIAGRCAGWVP